MRPFLLLLLGVAELGVAVLLVQLSTQVPTRPELEQTFQQAEAITSEAQAQLVEVRDQVKRLQRPELQQLAKNLQKQLHTVARTLHDRKLNFQVLTSLDEGLEGVITGLDGTTVVLDPGGIDKLSDGLGQLADFLDQKFVPSTEAAADSLDKATALLADNAREVGLYFKNLPQDFKALREVHDSLAQFGEGLDGIGFSLEPKRLEAMREGLQGMQQALSAGADQVTNLGDLPYPDLGNLLARKPKKLLPDAAKMAAGMSKAAKGVQAVEEELAKIAPNLPKIRISLEASKKTVEASRINLKLVLKKQAEVEPILKDLPQRTAQLAEKLPQLGQNLAKILREAKRIQTVAVALRQAQSNVKEAARSLPELRQTVQTSAKVLRAARRQLTNIVRDRPKYEKALEQSAAVAEHVADALPDISDQLLAHLSRQEQSLDRMSQSLGKVSSALPQYGTATGQIADIGRWLLWLIAAVVALHGVSVLLGLWTRRAQPV
jgi:DNA repair ATPase RecN